MVDYYNLTAIAVNASDPTVLVGNVNTVLFNGWYGGIIVFIVFSITFMQLLTRNNDKLDPFSAGSVLAMFTAWIIHPLGWSNNWVFGIATVFGVIAPLIAYLLDRPVTS